MDMQVFGKGGGWRVGALFCVGAIALTALTATTTGASAGVTVARDGRAISHSGATAAPVVSTAGGAVRGKTAGTTDEFLGIPYAAPPVGSLRWRPPQPAAGWKGVRDATKFAPNCAQPGGNAVRHRQHVRELPLPERVCPCGRPAQRSRPAGHGLDSRRRLLAR